MSTELTPRQKLWDYFAQDHNLTLTESELDDILEATGAYNHAVVSKLTTENEMLRKTCERLDEALRQ